MHASLRCISPLLARSGPNEASAICPLSGVKRTSAGLPSQSGQVTNESPYGPALGDCVDGVDGLARHFLPVASTARPWIDARVISAHDESERTPRLRAPSKLRHQRVSPATALASVPCCRSGIAASAIASASALAKQL